jgi:hypothetical protein
MPTYETWKWCGEKAISGIDCRKVATNECTCGDHHKDENFGGWVQPPTEFTDHPKFACDEHVTKYQGE